MEALILPELLDTRYSVAFSDLLKKQEDGFLLDGGSVARVGGLCFQLLVSAFTTAQALNVPFEIRNVSEGMKENLLLLGGDFLLQGAGES